MVSNSKPGVCQALASSFSWFPLREREEWKKFIKMLACNSAPAFATECVYRLLLMWSIHYSHPALASSFPGCATCSRLRTKRYESCGHKEKSRRRNVSRKQLFFPISSDIACSMALLRRGESACAATEGTQWNYHPGGLSLSNSYFVLLTRLLV